MFARRRNADPNVLVAETEAVLAGRYADLLVADNRPVPAWAWTNALAHATEETLDEVSLPDHPGPVPPHRAWWHARTYLAGEVLEAGRRCGSLARVQREALVPLELALMATPDHEQPTPADWVLQVTSTLDRNLR
ncbi:MAG TPA: hypothetical protein VIL36_22975 [Acidimicrobiales bacterium]